MTWLTEDPTAIIVIAVIVEVILVVALLVTRLAKVLVAIAAVAALTCLLVLVEWFIVTDREQVHDTLERLVANVKRGSVEGVISDLSSRPEARSLQVLVPRYLPEVDVQKIAIQQLEIRVDGPPPPNLPQPIGNAQPPPPMPRWARVKLRALVSVASTAGSSLANVDVTLIFAPERNRWTLVGLENYTGVGEDVLGGAAAPGP